MITSVRNNFCCMLLNTGNIFQNRIFTSLLFFTKNAGSTLHHANFKYYPCITNLLAVNTAACFSFVKLCDKRRGLNDAQIAMCFEYQNSFMPLVINAQKLAMDECQNQFAGRRWNCTFPHTWKAPHLIKPQMELPTKETAFVSAITTSAIMHKVSRACYENKLKDYCGCSQEPRPDSLPKQDLWGGCGDNLEYGYKFSKKFVDASETLENNDLNSFSRILMNLHNNEAGRWAVFDKSIIQCRCHGVTKNCATKMCYRQLGHFKEVGAHLQELHQSSIQVQLQLKSGEEQTKTSDKLPGNEMKLVEKYPNFNKFTPKDLLYLEESPSYCERDETLSVFGTSERKCIKDDKSLNDCRVLCCGRGHHTRREIIKEKCGCEFVYCCEVRCKTCEREENIHYCK